MQDTVLQRFLRFKSMIISADVPASVLLEMIESYITTTEDTELPALDTIVMDG